jgi:2,4-dienoyl-CoA reductase-like NADH-dependent reductase (Old Yellow Enzyme family)
MTRDQGIAAPAHAPLLYSGYGKSRATSSNRFLKSAMSEVLAVQGEHLPTDDHLRVYRRWAAGGTGVLMSGNVMIDRTALGEPGNVVLEDDSYLDRFKAWAMAVHEANPETKFWMQINHPGKQSPKFLTPAPVAPSAIALGKGLEASFATPRSLTDEEVRALIKRYATTAGLAKEAGFDGVQIHGAHGYLVSQFLSPHHNRRKDDWGGTPENRRRFVVEVFRAIRKVVGDDFPVGIKMNSADFQTGGFEGQEALDLISALSEEGIDLIEISGGNYENPAMTGARQSTKDREAYFLDFAASARKQTDVALAVTGGFRSVQGMESALESGATDFVGIARPLTIDPELPINAAKDPGYVCDIGRPSTGVRNLDKMFMIAITYYETQIRRISRGQDPDPKLSAWKTVLDSVIALGKAGFQKRRA